MPTFMRQLLVDGLLPENLPVVPIDREDYELVPMRHRHAIVSPRSPAVPRRQLLTIRHRRCHEDAIPPNNRRRMPFAWQSHLPANILRLAPLDGRVGVRRSPSPQGPAPLRPIRLRRMRPSDPQQQKIAGQREESQLG